MMKKCLVIDIDGVLAESEKWQKEFFCSGFHDEKGYMDCIAQFNVNKYIQTLIGFYWSEFYDIFLLTSRSNSYRAKTMDWLKYKTTVSNKIKKIIMKTDENQDNAEYKLEQCELLSKTNDIDFIIDDNPKVVKLLQENGYNTFLVKTLYK